ncbi:MAG: hypothetical protein WAM71_03130 [Candidatus Korobacteraceae bacterium]
MDVRRIMKIMDASYRTRRTIEKSLHEIDRRALNAMVLVKRHGTKLAGYGVIAEAFREQASSLKESAAPLQQAIDPLVRAHMRILQYQRFSEMQRRTTAAMLSNGSSGGLSCRAEAEWNKAIAAAEADALKVLRRLVGTVVRLQEGITEQEYVVTNGRIEAALSENSGAPLMRVSHEMGVAVAKVRDAIWQYRGELEEVLNESSPRF